MCARQYLKHFMWCGAIGFKCCGFFCVERQKNTRTDSFFIAINHIISDLILSLHNCIFAFSSSSSASFSFWSNDTVFAKWTIFFLVSGNCTSFEISFQVQLMYRVIDVVTISEFFSVETNDGQTTTTTSYELKSFIHKSGPIAWITSKSKVMTSNILVIYEVL